MTVDVYYSTSYYVVVFMIFHIYHFPAILEGGGLWGNRVERKMGFVVLFLSRTLNLAGGASTVDLDDLTSTLHESISLT